jgi:hypothetical protein
MDTDEGRVCYMFLRKLISVEYFAADKHSHIFTIKSYAAAVHSGRTTEKSISEQSTPYADERLKQKCECY